jgi:hypothetical protein
MELLMALLALIASLLAVDVTAISFGAESRDSIGNDWTR